MPTPVIFNGNPYNVPNDGESTAWASGPTGLNALLLAMATGGLSEISIGSPANGLALNSSVLTLSPATSTTGGAVSITSQSWAGTKTFTSAIVSTLGSGDAFHIRNGAFINFSSDDTNARLYRTALNTIATDGTFKAGTSTAAVTLNQGANYFGVNAGATINWDAEGIHSTTGSAKLGFDCGTANTVFLKSNNLGSSAVNVRLGTDYLPSEMNANNILLQVGAGFGADTEVDLVEIHRDDVSVTSHLKVTGNVNTYQLATPVITFLGTDTIGGTLVAGDYYYRVSALNDVGETLASAEVDIEVPNDTMTNQVRVNWSAVPGATLYNVYGRTTGAEQLLGSSAPGEIAFLDDGSITPSGALPTLNTTGAIVSAGNISGQFSHVRVTDTDGTELDDAAPTTIIFGNVEADALSEYDFNTGVFTAKYPGTYLVNSGLISQATSMTAGDTLWSLIAVNNSFSTAGTMATAQTLTMQLTTSTNAMVVLSRGDTIKINGLATGTDVNLVTTSGYCYLTIDRLV